MLGDGEVGAELSVPGMRLECGFLIEDEFIGLLV
jgi:hypothetical protein